MNWPDFASQLWVLFAVIGLPSVIAGVYIFLGWVEPRMPTARYDKLKEIVDFAVKAAEQLTKQYDFPSTLAGNVQKKNDATKRVMKMAADAGIPQETMAKWQVTVDTLIEAAVQNLPRTYWTDPLPVAPTVATSNAAPLFPKNSNVSQPTAPTSIVPAYSNNYSNKAGSFSPPITTPTTLNDATNTVNSQASGGVPPSDFSAL